MSASFRLLGRREVPSVISKQPGGGRVFSLTSFPLGVWPNILGGPWTSACCRGFLYSLGWWCLLLYPISAVSAHPGVQKEQFYFSQTDKAHKPPFPLKKHTILPIQGKLQRLLEYFSLLGKYWVNRKCPLLLISICSLIPKFGGSVLRRRQHPSLSCSQSSSCLCCIKLSSPCLPAFCFYGVLLPWPQAVSAEHGFAWSEKLS